MPLGMAPAAATELTLYRHENARQIGTRPIEEVGEGRAGVIWYVATLLAVFFALHTDVFNRDWLGAGRLEAGPLLAGEWWRAVTALTLHIELDHLGGNLAFGAFFGYFIGRYLGAGVGWLAVLLAAAGANVLNAWVQSPAHRSIGASTAVFAALGLLVAYTWRRGFLRDTPWRGAHRADRRGLRPARVHGHGGREHRSRRAPVRFHRGLVLGVGIAQLRADGVAQAAAVQRLCGAVAVLVLVAAWARRASAPRVSSSSALATSSRKSRSFAIDSASRAFSV